MKNYWAISGLITFFALILYLSIAPTRLSNANYGIDGGDFLAAILTAGIPHPTGYPTYTLIGMLFQYVPISTPVFRGVLVSLIPAAFGAGLLTSWMGYILGEKSLVHLSTAALAGLAWFTSPLLFSQAVIVDVHGLQSLIVVLFLCWVSFNIKGNSYQNKRMLLCLSFLIGLGCGNHVTIALFLPVAIFALVISIRLGTTWKFILAQIFLGLIGLLVYLYLPIRALTYPPINWGNPQTLDGFLWQVTGNPYRGLLFSVPSPILWERILSLSHLLFDQFGALGLVAGVIGISQYKYSDRWLRWILVWIFCVYIIFAIGYNTWDSVGYLLPAMLIFSIWIGLALPPMWVLSWKKIPVGIILSIILGLSLLIRIPGTMSRLDAREHDQAARYAEKLLSEAPEDAIIFTSTTQDTFPLWYYHFGLKIRPDLRIVVLPLTQFAWYQNVLTHTYVDLSYPSVNKMDVPNTDWGKKIRDLNPNRPVCNSWVSSDVELGVDYQCITR